MATTLDYLKAVNAYPIPPQAVMEIAAVRGLSLDAEATADVLKSDAYRLAKADTLVWLANAPNISQGGQSYTLPDEVRESFRNQADSLYKQVEGVQHGTRYGYKGSRL